MPDPDLEAARKQPGERGDLHRGQRDVAQRYRQQPDAHVEPSVHANAAAAVAIPLSLKQSSHSHSSSSPASSAARATARSCSGGSSGRNTTPRSVTA